MNENNAKTDFIDIINILSFYYGYLNYKETVNKNQVDDIVNGAIIKIQTHLETQDEKLDNITTELINLRKRLDNLIVNKE